jgi:hypothetical protein
MHAVCEGVRRVSLFMFHYQAPSWIAATLTLPLRALLSAWMNALSSMARARCPVPDEGVLFISAGAHTFPRTAQCSCIASVKPVCCSQCEQLCRFGAVLPRILVAGPARGRHRRPGKTTEHPTQTPNPRGSADVAAPGGRQCTRCTRAWVQPRPGLARTAPTCPKAPARSGCWRAPPAGAA